MVTHVPDVPYYVTAMDRDRFRELASRGVAAERRRREKESQQENQHDADMDRRRAVEAGMREVGQMAIESFRENGIDPDGVLVSFSSRHASSGTPEQIREGWALERPRADYDSGTGPTLYPGWLLTADAEFVRVAFAPDISLDRKSQKQIKQIQKRLDVDIYQHLRGQETLMPDAEAAHLVGEYSERLGFAL